MNVEQSPEISQLETAKAKVSSGSFRSARAHLRRARQLDTTNREAQRLLAVVVLTDDRSRPKSEKMHWPSSRSIFRAITTPPIKQDSIP